MNIKQAIEIAKEFKVDLIDARSVLTYILNKDKAFIVLNPAYNLSSIEEEKYTNALKKINEGYPLQYITHKQDFFGLEFYVNSNVLIPQPDTEVLVEQAIKIIETINKDNIRVLDLCTGSGAIAISIKNKFKKKIKMYATDISNDALNVARKNANIILKNEKEIIFIQSDMFEKVHDKFDLIISNPPYIETHDIKTLPNDVQNEPLIALDGGEDGLKYYKIINEQGVKHIDSNGYIILEIGYNQKNKLLKLFKNAKCIQDYQGLDRVIIWKKENI